jgi:hypothetical protein
MSAREVKHPIPADTHEPPDILHVWRGYEWTGLIPPIGTLSYCGRRTSTTRATMSCEDSPNDCVVCLDLAPEWEWGAI